MHAEEAIDRVAQILEEERRYPTVKYEVLTLSKAEEKDATQKLLYTIDRITASDNLRTNRDENPRTILQNERYRFQFKSDNYGLLIALLAHVSEADRPRLMQAIASKETQ